MSFLGRGRLRRGTAATVVAGSLFAFQALAVVGAGPAAAALQSCTYTLATQTVLVTLDNAGGGINIDTGDKPTTPDTIRVNGADCAGGSATVANTTQINVIGGTGNDSVAIWWASPLATPGGGFPSSIAFAVDGGAGTDDMQLWLSDGADTLTYTNTTFDANGVKGVTTGLETLVSAGQGDDDTLDASAVTVPVVLLGDNGVLATTVPGDDVLSGGSGIDTLVGDQGDDLIDEGAAANGADTIVGGTGFDNVYYGARTTAIALNYVAASSGADVNGDGDAADPGDEMDTIAPDVEGLWSGSGADTLAGDAGNQYFVPGDGNDEVDGNGGTDTLSYETSSAAVTIDPEAGTASGQGDDTFTDGVTKFVGSDFDDTLIYGGVVNGFNGGAGIDTVDASAETVGVSIDLSAGFAGTENVLGGSGPDTVWGNNLNNTIKGAGGNDWMTGANGQDRLNGGGGQDDLYGGSGNDTLVPGGGDDYVQGDSGADTISFKKANGVVVDISLGFASGQGDDSLAGDLEIVKGSNGSDNVTGGLTAFGGATNLRFYGFDGNDLLTGSASNDWFNGGAGNDRMRGGPGDDYFIGGPGKDKAWGGPGTDFARNNVEVQHQIER